MNSLTIKGVIVEGLSIQTDNSQSKPINPISQIKKHANQLMSIGKAQRNGLANLIKLGLMGASLLTLPLSGYSAISATTSQTIQGTEPYFVLIDGTTRTPLMTTNELLGFGYIDKDGNAKTATSSMKDTLIFVDANMTLDQLVTIAPRDGSAYSINGLLSGTGAILGIDDDDGDDASVTAYGSYQAKWTKDGVAISGGDSSKFDPCSLYILELSLINDALLGGVTANTTYGVPSHKDYTPGTVSFGLNSQVPSPYVCYAKPNLNPGTGSNAGAGEWVISKGFLPASTATHPTTNSTGRNFPTTGFHGAYFELTVAGTTARRVIMDSSSAGTVTTSGAGIKGYYNPPESEISLELSTDGLLSNTVTVKLIGPSSGTAPAGPFTPTPIVLNSGGNVVYEFTIDNWYINSGPRDTPYSGAGWSATNYCGGAVSPIGGGYRVPYLLDMSNTNGGGWTGGTAGDYTVVRSIGGARVAEWGRVVNDADMYPEADAAVTQRWTRSTVRSEETLWGVYQYYVVNLHGRVMEEHLLPRWADIQPLV